MKAIQFLAAAVAATALFSAGGAFADTETVDGVEWTYSISDGCATIGTGYWRAAIPSDTAGDIVVPSTLGGCPVKGIGDVAFGYCYSITSVVVPDSVTRIGNDVFAGCIGLAFVVVDSANPVYDSRDNCNAIIRTGDNALIAGCKATQIPDSVTSIGDFAFVHCYDLASVTIPDSVTSIGSYAFAHCRSLASVTIPDSVTRIWDNAFYLCGGLTSVTIADSVASIGEEAFSGCEALTSVVVDSANPFYDSRDNCNAIIRTGDNTLIAGCKATQIPDSVTSIGDFAFEGCSGLTSVTIPDSVTSIGEKAFAACSGLVSVTIPNSVASIGDFAFEGCSGLTSVTIPDSVTSIGYSSFEGCSCLTSVTIPDSVTRIGSSAFEGCSGLTSVTIPDSVTRIGFGAFEACSGLTSLTIPYAFKDAVSDLRLPKTCEIIVRDKIQLSIATDATLPVALPDIEYWQPLAAAGGLQPYTWEIVDTDDWPSWLDSGYIDYWNPRGFDAPYLSGWPDEGDIGTRTFTLRVTDAEGASAEKTFTLEVKRDPNKAPVIDSKTPSAYNLTIASGETVTLSFSAHDPNDDSLTCRWYGSWYDYDDGDYREGYHDLEISGFGDTFDFSRPVGGEGIFYIGCEVSDGSRSAWAEWRITVRNIPVIDTEDLSEATEGIAYSATLAAHGGTEPYAWSLAPTGYVEVSQPSTFVAVGTAQKWNGDDSFWSLDLPFAFPFYGDTRSSVKVSSNGFLDFGDGASWWSEDASRPCIAVLSKDLRTDSGNSDIYVESDASHVTIRWKATYYDGGGAVNASATLYPDGRIVLSYGAGNSDGGFIGLSAGDGETQVVSPLGQSGSMENADDIVFVPAAPPAGMSLSEDGVLFGTPDEPGDYVFTVSVTDDAGESRTKSFTLTVAENGALRPGFASLSPEAGYVNMGVETAQRFAVETTHPTGGDVEIEWFLDGESAGTGATFDYVRDPDDTALHAVRCVAGAADLPKTAVREWKVGTMTVSDPEPTTVSHGRNASFSVEVVSSLPATVVWLDADTDEELGTGATLAFRNVTASRNVKAVATSALGVVTSAVATVTVDPKPAVGRICKLTGPAFAGNRLVLRAKTWGDPVGATFAWKRDGETVATTERLDIPALAASDFGTYTFTMANPHGTATTEAFVLEEAGSGVPVGWGASGHDRTTAPAGLTGVAQVASGMNFNLGLKTDGTVAAWGYNGHGGCDVPDGLSGVSSVAAGGYESQGAGFAVKTDGSVVAWGQPAEIGRYRDWYWEDDYDEYGNWIGDHQVFYWYCYTNGCDTVSAMPADLSDVVQVAVGYDFAIALKADGTVATWGLYDNDADWDWNEAVPDFVDDVVAVEAGSYFAMVLLADGTAFPFGPDFGDPSSAWMLENWVLDDIVDVAVWKSWREAGFGLASDGTISAWSFGGLWPHLQAPRSGAIAIDGGQSHAMALDNDGNVFIWGDTWYDQDEIPAAVQGNALGIAAGGYHCTAILPDADGDSIADADELLLGRDPAVYEDYGRVSVSGTVTVDGELPPGGVMVALYDAAGTVRARTWADADGRYSFDGVVPGRYFLKIEADGAVDIWLDGARPGKEGSSASFSTFGGDRDDADFDLAPGQAPALVQVVLVSEADDGDGPYTEENPPSEDTAIYLDMWPAETVAGAEFPGLIDVGEVAASHSPGLLSHKVTLRPASGDATGVPAPVELDGVEGETVDAAFVRNPETGSVRVVTDPAGAEIWIDYADESIGVTPLEVGGLSAAASHAHVLLLRKDGYLRPRPVEFEVAPGETTEIDVPLEPDTSPSMAVAVSSAIPSVPIYLDYLPTGETTPATVVGLDPASHAGGLWRSASHSILLRHPSYSPFAPRAVPEPAVDPETGELVLGEPAALRVDAPNTYEWLGDDRVDLGVSWKELPDVLRRGETAVFAWIVTNAGDVAVSGPWNERIVLENSLGETVLATRTFSGEMAAGSSGVRSWSGTVPWELASGGAVRVRVDVDPERTVKQRQGGLPDGVWSDSRIAFALPDLGVSWTALPEILRRGESASFRWTVSNAGEAAAVGPWMERVVLANSLGETVLAMQTFDGTLEVGASAVRSWSGVVPWELASGGAVRVRVDVDPDKSVAQVLPGQPDSAWADARVGFALPELAVAWTEVPEALPACGSAALSWGVSNTGSATADAPWIERVWLVGKDGESLLFGTNGVGEAVAKPLFETNVVSSLAAGATGVRTAEIAVDPAWAELGDLWLKVEADCAGALLRLSGSGPVGATAEGPIPFTTPDLGVGWTALPGSIVRDESATFAWNVTNAGLAAAIGPWTERIVLENALGETVLATQTFDGTLGAGASAARAWSGAVPWELASGGAVRVRIDLDPEGTLPQGEPGLADFALADSAIGFALPELAVAWTDVPAALPAGGSATLSWSVSNTGESIADAPWLERVWLVGKDGESLLFDKGEAGLVMRPLFETNIVSTLAAGATAVRTVGIAVDPAWAELGDLWLKAEVDCEGALLRLSGTGPVGATAEESIPFTTPDLGVAWIELPTTVPLVGTASFRYAVTNGGAASTYAPWVERVWAESGSRSLLLSETAFAGPLAPGTEIVREGTIAGAAALLAGGGSGVSIRVGLDPDGALLQFPNALPDEATTDAAAPFSSADSPVAVHAGVLSGDETWGADKVHLVTAAVEIPSGATLTIETGAVVKFFDGTALTVDTGATCTANGVIFTHVADDTAGGDTFGDGDATSPVVDAYALSGDIVEDDDTEERWLSRVFVRTVAARQRYPWNGLVDIDFRVAYGDHRTNITLSVSAWDETTGESLAVRSVWLEGDETHANGLSVTAGSHRLVWDAGKDNPGAVFDAVRVEVQAIVGEELYKVIDLSAGSGNGAVYPVSNLSSVPDGGWGDEYKTSKLVLRRIQPGTYTMGCETGEVGYYGYEAVPHEVTITKPFYIGVFEVTQKQWELVTGGKPSGYRGDTRPVEYVSFGNIRGTSDGARWPASDSVDATSFMGRLRARASGFQWDLPTEAQWEYACRAGTTTALNSGRNLTSIYSDDAMAEVGRYYYDNGYYSSSYADNKGGYPSYHTAVGSYLPNAWGLYDMHGNVWEWTLDWYQGRSSFASAPAIDPVGPVSGYYRVLRGGGWNSYAQYCRSAYRNYSSSSGNAFGFRLATDAASQAGKCSSAQSGLFKVDARSGARLATDGATETIAYSPRWGGAESCSVTDASGATLVESATEEGTLSWTPDGPGAYAFTHKAGNVVYNAQFTVLGDDVAIHGGTIAANETWSAGIVHLVTAVVTVPSGVSLAIEPGAVVKFMDGTGISVVSGGMCMANGVIFTHVADDSVGGDTMMDGGASRPIAGAYTIAGKVTEDDATEYRYLPPQALTGSITSDTKLRGYRTYIATNSVTVASGATLTLRPGTVVKFASGCSLTVNGTLNATGTRAAPIVFTSLQDDEHGGDTNGDGDGTYPYAGDWARIYAGGTLNMDHCLIRYCNNNSDKGAIQGTGGNVTFDNGIIESSVYECVRMNSGRFVAHNSIFRDASMGFGYYGGSGVYLYNCVVADCTIGCRASNKHFYNTVFYRCMTFLESTSSTCSYCLFYNPPGYGAQRASQVGRNGNRWGDPLFLDPANGDFRIAANSPCVDAADSSIASELDYYGQPRMNVTTMRDSGRPNARGICADIGLYEVEGDPGVPLPDIAVLGVTVPGDGPFAPGDEIVVSYVVTNRGEAAATGLVRDTFLLRGAEAAVGGLAADAGEVRQTYGLAPGGGATMTARVRVPAARPGKWTVSVMANAERDVYENATANNAGESDAAVTVSLPAVAAGGSVNVAVPANGSAGVAVSGLPAEGGAVVASLPAGARFVVGVGYVPDSVRFDAEAVSLADGRSAVFVPAHAEGDTVYAVLIDSSGATQTVAVSALASAAGLTVAAPADVPVTKRGPNVTAELVMPPTVREGRVYAAWVEYANAGDEDAPLPVFAVSRNSGGVKFAVSPKGPFSADALPLAGLAPTAPRGVLKPGEKGRAPFYLLSSGNLDVRLSVVTDSSSARYLNGFASAAGWRAGMAAAATRLCERGGADPDFSSILAQALNEKRGAGGAALCGTLRHETTGEPLAGYEVALLATNDDAVVSSATTDDTGSFALEARRPGDYQVRVYGVQAFAAPEATALADADVTGVRVTAIPFGAVSGVAGIGEALQAVEGAVVALDDLSTGDPDDYSAETDENGRFRFGGLRDGRYELRLYAMDTWSMVASGEFAIENGAAVSVNLAYSERGAVVSGRITDADTGLAVTNATVGLTIAGTGEALAAETDGEGGFRIEGVPAGDYGVVVAGGVWEGATPDALTVAEGVEAVAFDVAARPKAVFAPTRPLGMAPHTTSFRLYADIQDPEWDFDGDGVADSDEAFPEWTYAAAGTNAVTLAYTDMDGVRRTCSQTVETVAHFENIVVEGGVVLEAGGAVRPVSVETNRLVVSGAAASSWTAGMVVGMEEGEFGGFVLRLVSGPVANGGNYAFETEPATLDDLFDQYWMETDFAFDQMEVQRAFSASAAEAVRIDQARAATARAAKSRDVLPSLSQFSVTVDAFSPVIVKFGGSGTSIRQTTETVAGSCVEYKLANGKPVSKRQIRNSYVATLPMEVSVEAVKGEVGVGGRYNKFGSIQGPGIPGPWGIWLSVDLDWEVSFSVTASGKFGYEFSATAWDVEQWKREGNGKEEREKVVDWGCSGPSFRCTKLGGSIDVEIDGNLVLGVYASWLKVLGRAGVGVKIGATLGLSQELEYSIAGETAGQADSKFKLTSSIYGNIEGSFKWLNVAKAKKHAKDFTSKLSWDGECYLGALGFKTGGDGLTATFTKKNPKLEGSGPLLRHLDGLEVQARDPEWDFGDGVAGSGDATAHTYAEEGEYQVTLTAWCLFPTDLFALGDAFKKQATMAVRVFDDKPPEPRETADEERRYPVQSCDPNEMDGPLGLGAERVLVPGEWATYTIYFENQTNATADAQQVVVDTALSPQLDWSTFEMLEVAFGDHVDAGLAGKANGSSSVDFGDAGRKVKTTVALDGTAGSVQWIMRLWDPARAEFNYWPEDDSGFLPPNDPETHCGEGHVSYRVKVRRDAVPGTRIDASATIVFDYNEPIETDPSWWNTVAGDPVRIAFDARGNARPGAAEENAPTNGVYYALPDAPTREGYSFVGWTLADGTILESLSQLPAGTKSVSLRAVWAAEYGIAFDANGGTGEMNPLAAAGGEPTALPPCAFTRTDHAFLGWTTRPDGEVRYLDGSTVAGLTTVPGATETLYAVWADTNKTTLVRAGADLQSAITKIDTTSDKKLILVYPGTYAPIDATGRALEIRAVFGPDSDAPDAAPTVIDGGGAVRCATLDEGVVLSGFTLRNGVADNGGGVKGGALENCRIEDCAATVAGGGAWGSALSRCTVSFCRADGNGGGLFEGSAENTVVENCDAALFGGGAFHATLTGCTVYGCGAETGAGVAGCTVRNSIVWENRIYAVDKKGVHKLGNCANVTEGKKTLFKNACTYTDSSPKPAGTGNLAKTPLFVDAANGDFRLQWTSPVKNKGRAALSLGDRDLGGLPRRIGAPDMGAHEVPDGTPVPADYDGDGIADSAYFDAPTATWIVMQSRDGLRVETFGDAKATPVPADYDGDGAADFATYSATAKAPAFRIRMQLGSEPAPVALGLKGAEPFAADLDGDGKADPGVFQGNAKKPSFAAALSGGGTLSHVFGTKGAKAVAGDFDGDGLADIGCYTASASKPAFKMLLSGSEWNTLKPLGITLGAKGSAPCCGDFDGDGLSDFAAYAGSAKTPILYRVLSTSRWRETRSLPFGEKGSRAATGDWDGDGVADPAVETRGAWRFVTPTWNVEEIPAP